MTETDGSSEAKPRERRIRNGRAVAAIMMLSQASGQSAFTKGGSNRSTVTGLKDIDPFSRCGA
jgi:hypothetical protein